MNSSRQQLSIQLLTEIPSDYHDARHKAWGGNASFWASYIDSESDRAAMLDRLARRVAECARGAAPEPRITDFGCGEGLFLRLCSQRLPHADLIGVDFSPEMLAVASNRSKLIPITYTLGDLENDTLRPSPDSDVAVSILVLDEVQSLRAAFNNISAALRPRGSALVVILDPITERLRHCAYLPGGRGDEALASEETLLILKPFLVGRQASPSPYSRIVRPHNDYIDAAAHSGLKYMETEIWPVGSAAPSFLIGPMVRVMTFQKSSAQSR